MIIKVCGMREPANIREVARLDVDWVGFIFYSKSPRVTDGSFLADDTLFAGHHPRRIGVFVDASPESMMEAVNTYHLDYLQLHGHESSEVCRSLQKRGYSLIKAFSIATREDVEKTQAYEGRVDYFLFDTKCEGYGGSGRRFDWSVLDTYQGETPFLLSGGIYPDSVKAICDFRHPQWAGIDLNSGFEIQPGLKDVNKLREFIRQVRPARSSRLTDN